MDTPTDSPRMPLTSADPLGDRLARLRGIFPEAFTEGRFDAEKLRAVLGEKAVRAEERERYGLSWAGKSDALRALRTLTTATLRPAPGESVNFDTTGHAIIEGDNLEVLKVLQHAYARDGGKVKLIYIDPPYNTGGDFIYPDDYSEGLGSYLQFTRQADEQGVKLTTNVDTSGRYHSRWLTMMYPRLFLARNLLREDGVIFVSIDDHEVHNLRLVMDEIFGEENFVGCIVWQKTYSPANDKKGIDAMHDYLLCYQRSDAAQIQLFARTEKQDSAYTNPDNDPRGPWKAVDATRAEHRDYAIFPIKTPSGREVLPAKGRSWVFNRNEVEGLIADNRLWFGKDGNSKPSKKLFISEVKQGVVPTTWWSHEDAGHNDEAKKDLKALFADNVPFETPKPIRLIRRTLELGTTKEEEGIVLDFFAGSGVTAQAVMELNAEDGGNRKFVLVQLPEPTGREDFPTIAEITKERVRRVIAKIHAKARAAAPRDESEFRLMEEPAAGDSSTEASVAAGDLGFRVFKLAESNFAVWDPALAPRDPAALAEQWKLTADNVRADAGEQALLCELMLKSGLPLHAPAVAHDAAGQRAYALDEGRLLICLSRNLTREVLRAMAALKPKSVLCLDVAFKGNDALKVNAQLEFQSHGIQFRTA